MLLCMWVMATLYMNGGRVTQCLQTGLCARKTQFTNYQPHTENINQMNWQRYAARTQSRVYKQAYYTTDHLIDTYILCEGFH